MRILNSKVMTTQNPLGLKKIHHVEFYVGNAKQAEFYYRKAFGFSRAAYRGLETGDREVTSYVMRQNRVNFVLTTPMGPEHPAAERVVWRGRRRRCIPLSLARMRLLVVGARLLVLQTVCAAPFA